MKNRMRHTSQIQDVYMYSYSEQRQERRVHRVHVVPSSRSSSRWQVNTENRGLPSGGYTIYVHEPSRREKR